WAEEKGQISAGVGPALDKRQRERKAYCYRQQFPTKGDKAVRAQSIRGRMALDGLYVSTNAPWLAEFKRELSFPAGKHDDQIDALGLIGQLLDQMVPGQKPKPLVPPKRDTGYRPIGLAERPLDCSRRCAEDEPIPTTETRRREAPGDLGQKEAERERASEDQLGCMEGGATSTPRHGPH